MSVAVADGHIPAYRAHPWGKFNRPVVLVVQEVFGVHEHIKDLCRRLAKAGYYAIAPSLYARFGDPGKYDMAHAKDLMTDIVSKVPDNEVMSDLEFDRRLRQGRRRGCVEARRHRLLPGAGAWCGSTPRIVRT